MNWCYKAVQNHFLHFASQKKVIDVGCISFAIIFHNQNQFGDENNQQIDGSQLDLKKIKQGTIHILC